MGEIRNSNFLNKKLIVKVMKDSKLIFIKKSSNIGEFLVGRIAPFMFSDTSSPIPIVKKDSDYQNQHKNYVPYYRSHLEINEICLYIVVSFPLY